MTRDQKIHKLANAIRVYVGAYDAQTLEWKRMPKPSEWPRVIRWLAELGLSTPENRKKIQDGFKTDIEFNAWIKKLTSESIAS